MTNPQTKSAPATIRLQNRLSAGLMAATALLGGIVAGCETPEAKPQDVQPRYETLPPKVVPTALKGTILELVDAQGTDGSPISAFGLVVNLPGTGDTTAPLPVREYLAKEMTRRGFGRTGASSGNPAARLSPTEVLNDPTKRVAIVRVDALVPPGVRRGQRYDVVVSAMPDSTTTGLSGGLLYQTAMKIDGADPRSPQSHIIEQGIAQGYIFANPAIALNPKSAATDPQLSRLSRRQGVILDGGISVVDRPILLRLRSPQRSVSRAVQVRLNERFQTEPAAVASAKDEGMVELTVPESFGGDWEHFLGLCMNTYMSRAPDVVALKSRQLAEEALWPNAPLLNISYAWESMGTPALAAITPLMSPKYPQDVQFAAARAAACMGDGGGVQALITMALDGTHQFQVDAIRVLGRMSERNSLAANALSQVAYGQSTRDAVSPRQATLVAAPSGAGSAVLARVEAYKALSDHESRAVISRTVGDRYFLDVIPGGRPMVFATRSGRPRLAIFGEVYLSTPLTFTALDQELTLSCQAVGRPVDLYYRGPRGRGVVNLKFRPQAMDLAMMLGGVTGEEGNGVSLTYSEVVAVFQAMADAGLLVGPDGRPVPFALEDVKAVQDDVESAPPLPGQGRPTGEKTPELQATTRPVTPPVPDSRP